MKRICRPWTDEEEAAMRRLYGVATSLELAAMLGHTRSAVFLKAREMGLRRPGRQTLATLEGRLRELHSQGLHDPEIGRLLGVRATVICRFRRRLGLPANCPRRGPRPARVCRLVVAGQERAAARAGYASVPAWMRARLRLAANRVWPGCDSVSDARACRLLAEGGPKTAEEIAEALGRKELARLRARLGLLVARGLLVELRDGPPRLGRSGDVREVLRVLAAPAVAEVRYAVNATREARHNHRRQAR